MKHLDLFSGIGGFAYAIDQVWDGVEHIFCDNDKFCRQVLKKHWPNSKIYGDIRYITNTASDGCDNRSTLEQRRQNKEVEIGAVEENKQVGKRWECEFGEIDLLTGGFPCQPFSQAGKRKGTEDDRHLWPEMLRVIRLAKPQWVIAENVRGILTIGGGLVFEQVCLDLEAAGYEVQTFIIPAVAVNAPHRRDRVWFVAHSKSFGGERKPRKIREKNGGQNNELHGESFNASSNVPDTESGRNGCTRREVGEERKFIRNDWQRNWLEVATFFCGMDAKFSDWLDRCFDDVIYLGDYENINKSKRQDLSNLRKKIQSEEVWEKVGRFIPLLEQEDLLAVMRKLQEKSDRQNNLSSASKEIQEDSLRCLWETAWACMPSQRREYQKQLAKELADIMPQLPHEVTLEVAEIWNRLSFAYSSMNAPETAGWTKARHRVERLKSLGNSIVPQVAIEIMKSLALRRLKGVNN